jgi:putative tricarboxylic transport membrane protein
LLVAMYVGSVSGGLITATLLNMPGTPASVITTLDGYPMAQSGRPRRALGLGIGASLVGGLLAWVLLATLAKPAADMAHRLGPFDRFSLVLTALVFIAAVSDGPLRLGILSGLLGMLFSYPGMHPATGTPRLTFGLVEMNDGFRLLPALIGLFAMSQILRVAGGGMKSTGKVAESRSDDSLWVPWREWRRQFGNLLRSSLIGSWIGVLPGIGANIGSTVAYGASRHFSKQPEKFGKGSDDGIVASESANNATVGGALIPLVALGIPGSVIDAILLGALVIHGLQPGPLLFKNHPETVATVVTGYLIANLVMAVLMWLGARWMARLTRVPQWLLMPVILYFCVLGSYALANRMFDVWVMLGFGLVGYAMSALRIPLAPFVIGFVLAPLAEENLAGGLMASGGSWLPLVQRPFSLVCLLFAAVFMGATVIRQLRQGRQLAL